MNIIDEIFLLKMIGDGKGGIPIYFSLGPPNPLVYCLRDDTIRDIQLIVSISYINQWRITTLQYGSNI